MTEADLNIIENKDPIKGEIPNGAQYALLNPTKEFIQTFYKFKEVEFSDNTKGIFLYYYSSFGVWQPSQLNSNSKGLEKAFFIKL